MKRLWTLSLALGLTSVGCLPMAQKPLQTVQPSPFGPAPAVLTAPKQQLSPASKQEALRVDIVGQKLIEANRQVGIRPSFQTLGSPTPELFHRGTIAVVITEGLTKQCRSDGQLAALLAYEMGRMVAEREALASPAMRVPEKLPPLESRVGTDSGGVFGSADGVRLAELARLDKDRVKPDSPPPPPPDPRVLAVSYLEKAGFSAKDLEEVGPLVKQVRGQGDFERQLQGSPVVRPWTD